MAKGGRMRHRATIQRWGALWHSVNKLDGHSRYFIRRASDNEIALFRTRNAAREWIKLNYGYILQRPDLRREPHGWKYPKAVKVKITLAEVANEA
jgi:hypothetical protein